MTTLRPPGRLAALLARIALVGLALVLLAPPAVAGKRTYKGKNFDAQTGQSVGRYEIRTKTAKKDGQKLLKVRVRCLAKKKKCTVLREKKFKLFPGLDEFEYEGSFELGGSPCTVSGYVYSSGFETTFNCEDGRFGGISGRRKGGGSGD
ncbi:MAG: hypothetical protein ACQGVK_25010 [Myxococcota bacterium]